MATVTSSISNKEKPPAKLSWKERKELYEKAEALFEGGEADSAANYKELVESLKDRNLQAQQQAMVNGAHVIRRIISGEIGGHGLDNVEFINALLGSFTARSANKAQELLVMSARALGTSVVIDGLLAFASSGKAKKSASVALETVSQVVSALGAAKPTKGSKKNSAVDPRPLVKNLGVLISHSDPQVRRSAIGVCVSLVRVGVPLELIRNLLGDSVRPALMAKLQEKCASITPDKENASRAQTKKEQAPKSKKEQVSKAKKEVPAEGELRKRVEESRALVVEKEEPEPELEPQSMLRQPLVFQVETAEKEQHFGGAAQTEGLEDSSGAFEAMKHDIMEYARRMLAQVEHAEARQREQMRHYSEQREELIAVCDEYRMVAESSTPSIVVDSQYVNSLSLKALKSLEQEYSDALDMIRARKQVKTEEQLKAMTAANLCRACGDLREQSAVLLPCKHLVCASCAPSCDTCPHCDQLVQSQFVLEM